MPHTRKLMKLTGDIHPPEVETDADDFAMEDAAAGNALGRNEVAMPETMAFAAPGAIGQTFEEEARSQVRRHPLAMLGAAFALGFVLVKLFR